MKLTCLTIVVLLVSISPALAAERIAPDHAAKMAAGLKLFASDVRPILTEHCVRCHGGEKVSQGLNLASRELALAGGKRGPAIAPGDHAASLLYKKITHEVEPGMPFKRPKLADAQIAAIARWIDLGAPYDKPLVDDPEAAAKRPAGAIAAIDREHWAYQPLHRAQPPAVRDAAWTRTPIDRFVLARLERQGLRPNADADRRTLIRRVYFDLIGLPPTPEEVDAFVADTSADAYEKIVDRLLADPRYGERWARHWMDVARYGESDGYEQDYDRQNAYTYRDFLIRAFNDDLPYDTFVKWQIAGDELAPDQPLAWMATGFLGAGAFPTQLTEKEFESARYTELDDMAQAIGASFIGLTLGCARCHDHKYDAIPERDYYRFVATFATTIRSEIPLDVSTDASSADPAKRNAVAEAQAALDLYESQTLPAAVDNLIAANHRGKPVEPTWAVLEVSDIAAARGTSYARQPDGSLLATGNAPATEVVTFTARVDGGKVTALRVEALADPSMPKGGPGLAANGNFCLGEIRVQAAPAGGGDAVDVKLSGARATFQQNDGDLAVAASLDGDPKNTGWAVDTGGIGKDQAAVFDFAAPVGFDGGTLLKVTLRFEHPNARHAMGRPRLSVARAPGPIAASVGETGPPPAVQALLAKVRSGAALDGSERAALSEYVASQSPDRAKLREALAAAQRDAGLSQSVTAMVTSEGFAPRKHHADGRGFPHFYPTVYILSRGDSNQKQGEATQAFLQVLTRGGKDASYWQSRVQRKPGAPPKARYQRAAMAEWITDTEFGAGELTARVIVNRLWHHHFGQGIVSTPIDFGVQGSPPTHPELLDWLAADLVEHGWKLKRVHRMIVTSAAYTQSADRDDARMAADPDNALLWRWKPRRLEAEPIRDAMLAIAGQLDTKMYGRGTLDENMNRRSIYFFIKRSKLIPTMMLFDWPEHLVSIGSRSSTTIAPQALAMMNSPQVRRYATGFAGRIKGQADPIGAAYRLALSRSPDADERAIAERFIAAQQAAYTEQKSPNARDLAVVDFCQSLFGTNEFVYLD